MKTQTFTHKYAKSMHMKSLHMHVLYKLARPTMCFISFSFFNRSAEGPEVEPCRGPAIFWWRAGHLCSRPTKTVQCFVAAVAYARTHGPHPSALHDPQHMHQHFASAPHHADRAATWRSFPVQRYPRGQRFGNTPHDSVLHPCIRTFRWRGDQSAGTYCRCTAHLHTGC